MAVLDDFWSPALGYFDDSHPRTWQLGTFSSYCYTLPGFPTDRKERKQTAFELWQAGLQKVVTNDDATDKKRDIAEKLLNAIRKKPVVSEKPAAVHIQNHITITGGVANVGNIVGTLETTKHREASPAPLQSAYPPPAYEPISSTAASNFRKRKAPQRDDSAEYEAERSSSASPPDSPTAAPAPQQKKPRPAPPPPVWQYASRALEEQPIRQRLCHLKDTSLKEIINHHTSSVPHLEHVIATLGEIRQQTLSHLDYIDSVLRKFHAMHKVCLKLSKEVEGGIDGLCNDPQLMREDYMMTEKDDTGSEAETVIAPVRHGRDEVDE